MPNREILIRLGSGGEVAEDAWTAYRVAEHCLLCSRPIPELDPFVESRSCSRPTLEALPESAGPGHPAFSGRGWVGLTALVATLVVFAVRYLVDFRRSTVQSMNTATTPLVPSGALWTRCISIGKCLPAMVCSLGAWK